MNRTNPNRIGPKPRSCNTFESSGRAAASATTGATNQGRAPRATPSATSPVAMELDDDFLAGVGTGTGTGGVGRGAGATASTKEGAR